MAKMLTQKQHEVLSLICDNTIHQENDTHRPLVKYWMPKGLEESCPTLNLSVGTCGSGFASTLRGLERNGFTKAENGDYAYSITEEGRLALERYREKTGFYNTEGKTNA